MEPSYQTNRDECMDVVSTGFLFYLSSGLAGGPPISSLLYYLFWYINQTEFGFGRKPGEGRIGVVPPCSCRAEIASSHFRHPAAVQFHHDRQLRGWHPPRGGLILKKKLKCLSLPRHHLLFLSLYPFRRLTLPPRCQWFLRLRRPRWRKMSSRMTMWTPLWTEWL